jgi:hypothetical protein
MDVRDSVDSTRADAVGAFYRTLYVWNVRSRALPSFSCLVASIILRMRTRLPTSFCTFLAILPHSWLRCSITH